MFARRGYESATLREIAAEAGVSPSLLYKYFPGKSAVVMELYDRLSLDFVREADRMTPGRWWERSLFALETSLGALSEHRSTLTSIVGQLVGDPEQGLFSDATAFSRERVQGVFLRACAGSKEGLPSADAHALATVVYVAHLAVLLWWLLDRSPDQRATDGLVKLLRKLGPAAGWALRVPGARATIRALSGFIHSGLFGRAPD